MFLYPKSSLSSEEVNIEWVIREQWEDYADYDAVKEFGEHRDGGTYLFMEWRGMGS